MIAMPQVAFGRLSEHKFQHIKKDDGNNDNDSGGDSEDFLMSLPLVHISTPKLFTLMYQRSR